MEIIETKITVNNLIKGFKDLKEEGVFGYSEKLNIRPPYQREFIYDEEKSALVIDSILGNYPIGILYWYQREDNHYEVLDGQQRILSICNYIVGKFDYKDWYYLNLPDDLKEKILNYRLSVYLCIGDQSEVLSWFKRINIQGEQLTAQEFRNAVYAGPWLADAKKKFSKRDCPAEKIGKDYIKGRALRQEILEEVIKWFISTEITHKVTDDDIKNFMAKNQHKENAEELWQYFKNVVGWVKTVFPKIRKEMNSVQWGPLYNQYKNKDYDPKALEKEIQKLILDDDVTCKKGIYVYLITGEEKYLNIRQFGKGLKQAVYEKQNGKCVVCNEEITLAKAHADHIIPWSQGGKTTKENCQILCGECNLKKGAN